MKKVLFVAIIATLIAVGCEKTEIINPNLGTEILFSPELGKLTKADDPGIENLQQQGFKVTAINSYEDIYTTDEEFGAIYDGIKNTEFTYKNGAFVTDKQYWWPGTDKDLVFLAISSAKKTNIPENVTITGTPNEQGLCDKITMTPYIISAFEVDAPGTTVEIKGEDGTVTETTLNPDNDLMIADAVHQNQGDKKVVDLKFRHALSKVQFLFVTNGQNVQNEYPALILSVDKENITTGESATFTVVYKPDANTTETLTGGYLISYGENSSLGANVNVFTPTTDGQYTFTASYTADNETYISNEVVVTVGQTPSENVVERTANEDITVTVNSIKVASVISKGDLTVTPIWEGNALLSSYNVDTFKWTPSQDVDDKKDYSITKDLELTTVSEKYATWLVIPQTIKEGNTTELKVEIKYTINDREFTSIFPLYTKTLTKWGVNQYIKYTINLSPNLITFNPSVEDWTTNPDVNQNN